MDSELSSNWQERALRCIQKWELAEVEWLPQVSTARVGYCECSFGPALLKISLYPGTTEAEARALLHFGNSICPTVFGSSYDDHAILMERIDSSHDLTASYPSVETEVEVWLEFYRAIQALPAVPSGFPTLADYSRGFDFALDQPLSTDVRGLMQYASDHRGILMASEDDHRLLHGDMHHSNMICDRVGRWRIIDPHGVIGNPLYEIGAFMRNPMAAFYHDPDLLARLKERVDVLSRRLDLPPSMIAQYGFYGVAFSIAWDIEDGNLDADPKLVELGRLCIDLST